MSITDELRESVKQTCWAMTSKAKWFAIADRIDIEHKKAVDIAFTNGRTEGIADGCAHYDTEHTECMVSEEYGWIRLPKDADGEYIYPKDILTDGKKVYTVTNITFNQCGFIVYGYSDNSRNEWPIDEVSKLHHYHEPTVEDVLREFGEKYCDTIDGCAEESELFAEYAAKLQLRGDGE